MNSANPVDDELKLKIYEKIKEILSHDNYEYAASVVTYSEAKSLEFNYTGMAEFRDALTHIKRAVYATTESSAMDELNSAFEHIRRAAVESIQEYIETKYANIRKRLEISPFQFWLVRLKWADKNLLINSEKIIKDNIRLGREAKPKKEWQEAIGYFIVAENELERLDSLLPTFDEIDARLISLGQVAIVLIIGFIFGQAYRLWT